MYKTIRAIPYIVIVFVAVLILVILNKTVNPTTKTILTNIFSNVIFLLAAYFFYDLIKIIIHKREEKYLNEYIKNQMANNVFVVLYYLKKIIHGYSLETNSLENILNLVNYPRTEIKNTVSNQNYIGFQIFKQMDEIRDIFKDVLNDNLVLKYSSHIDVINILKLNNLLSKIEFLLKNENNFEKSAEKSIEYMVLNGKKLNPENDDKYLLLKKTPISSRFVVYDSGYFYKDNLDNLLDRYVLKDNIREDLANNIYDLFSLIKYWIPKVVNISRKEDRFRIIKNYLSPYTKVNTVKSKIYVADIVDSDRD